MPHAEPRVLTPLAVLATLGAGLLITLGVYAAPWVAAAAVLVVSGAVALGWGRLLGLPSAEGVSRVLAFGAVAILLVTLSTRDERGLRWLPVALAVAIIASFLHQLVRTDGRPDLVRTIAGTALGLVVLGGGAFYVAARAEIEGREAVLTAVVAVALGSLIDLGLHARGHLAEWAMPASMLVGAAVAGVVAWSVDVRWSVVLLAGVISPAVAQALRRVLTLRETAAEANAQLATGAAALLVCGVIPYAASWLYR